MDHDLAYGDNAGGISPPDDESFERNLVVYFSQHHMVLATSRLVILGS